MINARRRFLGFAATAATFVATSGPALALGTLTPRQTAGPFYPKTLPVDHDADLVNVTGHGARAIGTIAYLEGQVFDPDGSVVRGARVEIWQCYAFGRYHHPRDGGGQDPGFQGFGRTETSAKGRYRFRTILPVPYPGRAPHIHMRIVSGGVDMTTQVYVEGDSRNANDFVLSRISDPKARASVIVPFKPVSGFEAGAHWAMFNPVILA